MSDEPLDLDAVASDDAAIERLRAGAGDDAALELLRALMRDVETDLPAATPVAAPIGHGSTVVALAVEPDRRLARGGAAVVALTAGLLSLGGVAAAATLAPAGSPLHGLGEAVRSAAGAVVGAVSPPATPARPEAAAASASPTALPSRSAAAPRVQPTPGPTVAALARSQAAARQVEQLLVVAADLLDDGRTAPAVHRLDLAERRLAQVLPVHRGTLPQRLADLRRLAADAQPARTKASPPAKPAPAAERKAERRTEPAGSGSRPQQQPQGTSRDGGKGKAPSDGQLSDSAASMNPRA